MFVARGVDGYGVLYVAGDNGIRGVNLEGFAIVASPIDEQRFIPPLFLRRVLDEEVLFDIVIVDTGFACGLGNPLL